ncbi:hypothetical protein HID58_050193 [Brassica napus]|uniref:Phospholipid-transporting ATPase n=1 Tax=Brassica napus TaxID=3708 RepID=A0ABQ8A5H3_BRANA|nr:hypothetical protein HID58_050193 [Brassica napus]
MGFVSIGDFFFFLPPIFSSSFASSTRSLSFSFVSFSFFFFILMYTLASPSISQKDRPSKEKLYLRFDLWFTPFSQILSQMDKPPLHPHHESISSRWSSVSFKDNKEVTFSDLGSKRIRHGSAGADSEMLSMSQKEIKDEDARLIYINDPDRTNETFDFTGNSIKTAKYSVFTFLPRNLFEQFHRVAYVYFLVIAVLNQLPQLAVFGRGASIMPLAFVLLVSAIKDAYEDFRRHRSDRVENNRLALVFEDNEFKEKQWKYIRVGEVIKVVSNQTLPCDMVLLATSDPTGVVYVQTTNLDGESNLKTRYAKQETLQKATDDLETFDGFIKCEKPNRNIYGFQANMEIDGRRLSLGPSNIILRGCELKNTEWALGVVVYAGSETKAMLNNSGAPSKRSRLETRMNLEIILLSLFLIALCTTAAATAAVWLRTHRDDLDTILFYRRKDYSVRPEGKNHNYYGWGWEIFFTFFMAVIVYQIMIPISLYISMELVRIGQAYFMTRDDLMYDESSNSSFQCRALNINEDLGQIKYLFSDKTGTLTDNKMEFQCACIGGVDYSDREPPEITLKPKMRVRVDPSLLQLTRNGNATEEAKHANEFFLSLAACNTIVPIVTNTSDPNVKLVDYQGESPDEQALVYAAAAYGFLLIERTSGHIVINVRGEMQRFNVLGLHEFDSDRKRMSVILGCPDTSVKLFVKGADSSMFSVMDEESYGDVIEATKKQLHAYSSDGLRTLVVGMRKLNDTEFEQWHSSFEAASTALIEEANASVASDDDDESVALIIDGTSLIYVLDNDLEDVLFQVACKSSAVLCCRVAPFQKAGIVALVKNRTSDMTLAIGDGANDVSMIQMADVGVGISGQEGRQAVMASDFAMGQFRFLVPLLLVHGHWNYQRMGYMILYNFYRNAVFVLILFWYVLFTCYTLTTAITEWSSVLYSVVYTSFPTIVIGILDKNLGRRILLSHPQLYGVGQRAEGYSTTLFWYTMFDTVWQSAAIFFIPLFAYWGSTIDTSSLGDLWTIAAVVVVNLHLAMDVIRWNWIAHAAIWGSIVAACICVVVIDVIPTLPGYWAIFQVAKTWMFWFCLLAIVVTALLPRFAIKFLVEYYRPSDVRIAREVEKLRSFSESQQNMGTEMNQIRDPSRS